MKKIDLTGKVFGKLTVVKALPSKQDGGGTLRTMYLVKCSCGNLEETPAAYLTRSKTNPTKNKESCVPCRYQRQIKTRMKSFSYRENIRTLRRRTLEARGYEFA